MKCRQAFNLQKAKKQIYSASSEFLKAAKLQHPNIVEYKYLVKYKKLNTFHCHIIMELIDGKHLESYIKELASPINLEGVASISR